MARWDRCRSWGGDAKPRFRRPREGPPSRDGGGNVELSPGRALYRTQARPACFSRACRTGAELAGSRMRRHRTGHADVSYRLLRGSHTNLGTLACPGRPCLQASKGGDVHGQTTGQTARVNAFLRPCCRCRSPRQVNPYRRLNLFAQIPCKFCMPTMRPYAFLLCSRMPI